MEPMKFRQKGLFLSEKRARRYAQTLKEKGERTRVEKRDDIRFGRCYLVMVYSSKEFWKRNFKLDLERG